MTNLIIEFANVQYQIVKIIVVDEEWFAIVRT